MASTPRRRRRVLSAALRLRLADAAPRASALANRLLPLSQMAPRRTVAPSPRAAASSGARVGRSQPRSERGYDGAKRLSGRKRQLLVDTGGLVLGARVHAAS